MKKIFAVLLAMTLLFSLTACGGKEEPAPTEAPAAPVEETPAPVSTEAPAVTEPEPTEEPAVEEEPSIMELAESFAGGEAADMIAAIGEPISTDYAPSCLGSGEDGILEYADFLVYTYRENGSERVDTVLAK